MLINHKDKSEPPTAQTHGHQFLQREPQNSSRRSVREVAVHLMYFYSGEKKSYAQWKKHGAAFLGYTDGSQWISFETIEAMIEKTNTFDFKSLKLSEPRCNWLDGDISIGCYVHLSDPKEPTAVQCTVDTNLGESFPLKPQLDREGLLFNSFQMVTQERVVGLWRWLLKNSANFASKEWFPSLRMLFSEVVSLIDMTLHQIYMKAQYDKIPGWNFDRVKLGSRIGRKLKDKLSWVGHITGRPLDDAREEIAALDIFRELRNHTQHFDPPCFCCTLEDVAIWLNKIPLIGRLIWKIRDRIGSPLSVPLIEMLLLPSIKFVPDPSFSTRRIKQGADSGYSSTQWSEGSENPIEEQLVTLKIQDNVLKLLDKEAKRRRESTKPTGKFSRAELIREILTNYGQSLTAKS